MPTRFALPVLVALLCAAPAIAQRGPRLEIESVQIGLPPGRFVGEKDSNQKAAPVVKRNTWAPIYVRLKMLREYDGGASLKIEATDADEIRTVMIVPLTKSLSGVLPGSFLEPSELSHIPYVRSSDSRSGEITLTVISDDGERELSPAFHVRYQQFRDISSYAIVSLGSRLPGFDLPGETKTGATGTRSALRNGRIETSAITNVREMPDQWFGYAAADLIVLTTGSATNDFLDELFDADKSRPFKERRDALLEWVRRGGQLVVSVGSNASKLAQLELFRDMLPAALKVDGPSKPVNALPLRWTVRGSAHADELRPRTESFPVARVAVNSARPPRILLPTTDGEPGQETIPVVLQSPYGLGRITMVTFDLDQSPFVDFGKRAEFWDWLICEAGSAKSALAPTNKNNNQYGYNYNQDSEDDYLTGLRGHVDTFDGVPVISFGWVALFIVLYTLIIGPVEYLFLKKVLGRLELTWVTFPLIVLTVSAAAYFTAYAIKGNDLKVNKVDIVDIDLVGGRVYGRAWFTVFSPRIDTYTVGIEPRDEWAVSRADTPNPPTLVDWMGGGRGGSGSIVSRSYAYHADSTGRTQADGLVRVPIQVWSTKAFSANWSGYLDKGTPPIVPDLYHPPGDATALTGSFTSNLPVPVLQNAILFYRGVAYKLPAISPGQKLDVPPTGLPTDDKWFSENAYLVIGTQASQYNNPRFPNQPVPAATTSSLPLWGALFHEKAITGDSRTLQNASLRSLDQSWRLSDKNVDEAILVAKIDTVNGQAETMMNESKGPSPTKLWLKGLPGGNSVREPVPGTLRQETYIRVYIPVRPAIKK